MMIWVRKLLFKSSSSFLTYIIFCSSSADLPNFFVTFSLPSFLHFGEDGGGQLAHHVFVDNSILYDPIKFMQEIVAQIKGQIIQHLLLSW